MAYFDSLLHLEWLGSVAIIVAGCTARDPLCTDGCAADGSGGSTMPTVTDGESGSNPPPSTETSNVDSSGDTNSTETGAPCPCEGDQLCVDDSCVAIENERCHIVWAPDGIPVQDTTRMGMLLPLSGPLGEVIGERFERAALLWADDAAESETVPPVTWLACDTEATVEGATAGAEHLVNAMGAIAVFGPLFEGVQEVGQVTGAAQALHMRSSFTDAIPGALVDIWTWSMRHGAFAQAMAVAGRTTLIGPAGGAPGSTIVFVPAGAFGEQWRSALETGAAPEVPVIVELPDPDTVASEEDLLAGVGAAVGQALEDNQGYAPEVVIVDELWEPVMASYQAAWSEFHSGEPAPRFIVAGADDRQLFELGSITVPGVPAIALENLESVAAMAHPDDRTVFELRYEIHYGEPANGAEQAYDAARALGLAACITLLGGELTGTELSEALSSLDGAGTLVDIAALDLACDGIAIGEPMRLPGPSGELAWNSSRLRRGDVYGFEFLPGSGTVAPTRVFTLDAPPAETGTWSDL